MASDGPVDVLVKVSSLSCFGLLTGTQGFLWVMEKNFSKKIQKALAPSLCAVYQAENGLVQVLPDLRIEKYGPLKPKCLKKNGYWTAMWDGFCDLVEATLLPLAGKGIVHPDIRPGFDLTANILVKTQPKPPTVTMRLIDLDSLISFKSWKGYRRQPAHHK
jgi:hypothetical protein